MNTAQVGTLETKPDMIAVLAMMASSINLTFLPNFFNKATSMRLDSGSVVNTAEMPNDAITNSITGLAIPDSAAPNVGATPRTGIRPKKKKQIWRIRNGEVISMTRNANNMPIVLIPDCGSPPISGIKSMDINIAAVSTMPNNCFGFKGSRPLLGLEL